MSFVFVSQKRRCDIRISLVCSGMCIRDSRYTDQQYFEKMGRRADSAAPVTQRKKKASPVIPVLCIAAAAVILGGVW